MSPWIWRNFKLELPDDWEMLRFSQRFDDGRCVFADRYQYRLEMTWRKVAGPPDFDRMMKDYMGRLETGQDVSKSDLKRSACSDWQGIEGTYRSVYHSRYGKYFARESCLVEIVLFWPDGKDAGLQRTILDSVSEAAPIAGKWRRWQAFGMDFLVSQDLDNRQFKVDPAKVVMRFSYASGDTRQERFERLGMVHNWLKESVAEWLDRHISPDVVARSTTTKTIDGHAIHIITGRRRRRAIAFVRHRWLRHQAAAWICPHDGRLYCTIHELLEKKDTRQTDWKRRMSCCDNLPYEQ